MFAETVNWEGKISPGDRLVYGGDYWEYLGPSKEYGIGRWRTPLHETNSSYAFGDFWKLERCKSSNFDELYNKLNETNR